MSVVEIKWLSIAGFPSSTSDDLAVTSETSLLTNTPVTEIEDEIKMNTREADLDDNHDMLDGSVENLSKKELKEEQSITDKKSEDTTSTAGEEQENLAPSIKEGLKRVCRKEKITINTNGKEGYYKVINTDVHSAVYISILTCFTVFLTGTVMVKKSTISSPYLLSLHAPVLSLIPTL